jgi:hypothetical protein
MASVTVRAFPVVRHAIDQSATAAGGVSQAFLAIDAVNHNNLLFSAILFNIARHNRENRRKRLVKNAGRARIIFYWQVVISRL